MDCRAINILKQLYTYCASLRETVKSLSSGYELVINGDDINYTHFCHTAVVAAQTIPGGQFDVVQTRAQLEILHSIVENMCRTSTANVLSLGYQQLRHNKGLLVAGTKNIESYYPNTISTYVNGQLWQKLLTRIGDDMMIYLLQNCSLFVKLDHGCFLQVTGPPIGNLFPTASVLFQRVKSRQSQSKQKKRTIDDKAFNSVPSAKRHKHQLEHIEPTSCHIDRVTTSHAIQPNPLEMSELYLTACESPDEIVGHPTTSQSHGKSPQRGKKRKHQDAMQLMSKKRLRLSYNEVIEVPRTRKKTIRRNGYFILLSYHYYLMAFIGYKSDRRMPKKDVFIRRSQLFYTQQLRDCFPSPDHILSNISSSRRGAKKLIIDVFTVSRLNGDWNNYQQQQQNKVSTGVNKDCIVRIAHRLIQLIPTFQSLIASHETTNYKVKLKKHCPLPRGFYEKSPSGELTGYITFDTLVGCYTSHSQVGDFVISVVDQVIPDVLWGSKSNRNTFYHHIRRFIKLGRYERFSLKQILHKMKPSQCGWLKVKTSGWRQVTDSNKQKQLFSEWLLWLMDELVVKLLKGYFYITESSNHRNKVFYYRKPVWKRIQQLALKDVTKTMLTRISQDEVKELVELKQTVGVAKLRLLPRVGGVRLIANMGSRLNLPFVQMTTTGKQEHSINSKLQNVFHVLNYEKMNHPEELGHSAFSPNDIYNTLLPFAQRLQEENRTGPLFFISVDISCCYDSIIQSKICDIIKKIIKEDEYTIRRYVTVMVSRNRIRRHYKRTATIPGDTVSFPEFANDSISNCSLRNAIISDQVVYPFEEKEAILATLKKHILQNIVKFGGNYYRQVQGISQGSILSALLCNYYYAAMEREYLPTLDPSESVMIRLADDFLLITKSSSVAKKFYHKMVKGIPDYNCFINVNKTVKNFELLENGKVELVKNGPQWIPWCGYLINTTTVEVRVDYSRMLFAELRDAVTVHLYSKPLHHMQQVLMSTIHIKCHPLLLSSKVNSEDTIIINIYQLFLLSAMKFHIYMKEMHIKRMTQSLVEFQFNTIIKLVQYCYKLIRNIYHEVPGCVVEYRGCQWLCFTAYVKILRRKQSTHLPLLYMITKALRRTSYLLSPSEELRFTEVVKSHNFDFVVY
ncbi:telomerase reverse transcriptase-like isoform X2 [Dysidea avara]|uniref:telomerase reverse transcriptase-like isoform X2 n=1 Tax=Dysidea avara TaxID=196820 RepID=UPI00331BF4C0